MAETLAQGPDPAPVSQIRGSLLRGRDFGLLFTGQAVSALGDRIAAVALPFAVLGLPHAGAADVGLVLGVGAVSLGVFVLIGGVAADRLPRHLTMLASDLARAAIQGVAAILLLTEHASVPWLGVLWALYGAAEAFFRPALLGLVPQVVDAAQVQPANALLALSTNVAQITGPAAAGILVATAGAGAAIGIDAATFVVSAASLVVLRPRPIVRTGGPSSLLTELRGGWHEVRTRTWVWSIILAYSAYHAFVLPALFVFGPLVAEQTRGGAGAWGLITAGFGSGALLGSVLALRWRPRRPGVVIGAFLCVSSMQAAIVVSRLPTPAVAALELVTGITVSLLFTIWETALQQRIDPGAQSRVSSFDYLGSLVLMPLGYLVMAPLGQAVGMTRAAVGASAVGLLVSLIVATRPPVRRMARLT